MINLPTFNYMDDWLWSIRGSQMSTMAPLVDRLFSVLGWVFSDKDQQGKQVKMLGTIIDAKRRKFFAPEKKVHKALGMIAALKLSPHGVVARKDVERTTGTVMSMNLAIPHIRVWTRALYRHTHGPGLHVHLSKESVKELEALQDLLLNWNGVPFISAIYELDLFTDAGEVGWGARVSDVDVHGLLPSHLIGSSSTRRELYGLLEALNDDSVARLVQGKVLRINIDSKAAVANLVKGGGPVVELCSLVKSIWLRCTDLRVTVAPNWVSRDDPRVQHVDALSKCDTKWILKLHVATNLQELYGVTPQCPDFARIGPTVEIELVR